MKSNSEDGVFERDDANDALNNPELGINDSKSDEDSCGLKTFERVRYFDCQLLTADDFTVEQSYHNDKRHLTNEMVNGYGIVRGLKVELLPPKQDEGDSQTDNQKITFILHSGMAIDRCGRELIVDNKRELSIDVSNYLRS